METLRQFLQDWKEWLVPLGTFTGTIALGYVGIRMVLGGFRRWRLQSNQPVPEEILGPLHKSLFFWVMLLGVFLAVQTSALQGRTLDLANQVVLIAWIVSLTWFGAGLASEAIRRYGIRFPGTVPMTSLTQTLVRVAVITIGGLILLNMLGVSITPILTALGVGGLAVALGLQDTLSNLFAGFHVSVAGHIRVGDYIKLESGEEGYVTDIGWRTTTVRMLANNLVIIPNAKLAQAIVTNYCLPEKRMSLLIPISVSYDSDPDEVERLLTEEAKKGAADIPGLLAEPAPFVRFIPGFGESSLNFTLICQVAEFVDQYFAQHELRKRIFKRFREAGIVIPFPIRTVHLHTAKEKGQE